MHRKLGIVPHSGKQSAMILDAERGPNNGKRDLHPELSALFETEDWPLGNLSRMTRATAIKA
jgi:hypothetical protein